MVFDLSVPKEQLDKFKITDFKMIAAKAIRRCAVCGRITACGAISEDNPDLGCCPRCASAIARNDLASLKTNKSVAIGESCELCINGRRQASQIIRIGGEDKRICSDCLGRLFDKLSQ